MIAAPYHTIIRKSPPSLRVNASPRSVGLNRVFAAAVVNRQFRDMLLENPREALQKGYLGEVFTLTSEESDLVVSIRAESLSDFARQVYFSLGSAD